VINWGLQPSAGYSCTNTELGLARIPLLVPIYLFTVYLSPGGVRFRPCPIRIRIAFPISLLRL
jgi:hypothetical protein